MFGGWRIVKTMGQRITKLKPVGGFCAETGGAMTLFIATGLGIPVSTTHTITGAIVGVGSVQQALRGALGRCRRHRLGMGADHPLLGLHGGGGLVAGAAIPVVTQADSKSTAHNEFTAAITSTAASNACDTRRP